MVPKPQITTQHEIYDSLQLPCQRSKQRSRPGKYSSVQLHKTLRYLVVFTYSCGSIKTSQDSCSGEVVECSADRFVGEVH